jgi:hypothetical protein
MRASGVGAASTALLRLVFRNAGYRAPLYARAIALGQSEAPSAVSVVGGRGQRDVNTGVEAEAVDDAAGLPLTPGSVGRDPLWRLCPG